MDSRSHGLHPAHLRRITDAVTERVRLKHLSPKTGLAYVRWIRQYLSFHRNPRPRELGKRDIEAFLSSLAVRREVGASTQNQALAAILFLYREVLEIDVPWLNELVRAKRKKHLPVVMTQREVQAVLGEMCGTPQLIATILYGSGLRLMEGCRLRIKDLDLARLEIHVREGKGGKDRRTTLPSSVADRLSHHLAMVKRQHQADLADGNGSIELPRAFESKSPRAPWEWPWTRFTGSDIATWQRIR